MLSAQTKILLVEDTEITRRILHQMLEQAGFINIVDAVNGVVAWAALEQAIEQGAPFDLILSDWNMPGMSGIDLLRKMQSDDRFAGLPFVLLTSNSERNQVMEAIRAGVSHYLVKPFPLDVLRAKLKEAMLEKKRA